MKLMKSGDYLEIGKQYMEGVMLRLKPVLSLVEGKHSGQAFTRRTSTGLSVTPLFYCISKNGYSKFERLLKFYTILLLTVTMGASCKKVIKLDLGNDSGQLVIEGNITDEPGPQYVKLSRNVPFTSTNTYPPVTGATVTIYDSTTNRYFDMTEGPAGTYSVQKGLGIYGHTYLLTANTGGKTYRARSVMPQYVAMDSITTSNNILDKKDNKRMITVYFNDPAGVKNQYRFVMYVNKVEVNTVFAFDDQFIDGKHVTLDLQQSEKDIYPGDTVKIEMQSIDRPVYAYWFTLEQQQDNNPGGAVAPSNPPTNITPATLGYFSAHTTQTLSIVAK